MHKFLLILVVTAIGSAFMLNPVFTETPTTTMTVAHILEKNVEAVVGGKEELDGIKNLVIDVQNPRYQQIVTSYYATLDGKGKIIYTMNDLIWMIATLKGNDFIFNSVLPPEDVTQLDKVRTKCFIRLLAGAFSLNNFKGHLKAEGIKKYGPEKNYILSTAMDDHRIEFHIDVQDFLLKRMLITGGSAESGKYESSYDFGPYEESDGVKVPNAYFVSTIGIPGGGSARQELRNLKKNIKIEPGFFDARDLSFGKVSWKDPVLQGNGIISTSRGPYYVIITNWSSQDLEKTGIQSTAKITLKIDAVDIDALYIANNAEITAEMASPGNAILLRNDQYFAAVVMWGEKFKPIHESFKKLCTISVTQTNK